MKSYLKENIKVFIPVVVINLILLIWFLAIFISLFMSSFKNIPEVLKEDEFKIKANNLGCLLINKDQNNTYKGLNTFLVSNEETCPHKMVYISLDNESSRTYYFSELLDEVLGTNSIPDMASRRFYQNISIGKTYDTVVLNNNNLFYISTPKANKNLVKKEFENYTLQIKNTKLNLIPYIFIIYFIILIISLWGIFRKIYHKGWYALIPFYNLYKLCQAIWGNGWLFLLSLIPIVNIGLLICLNYKIAEVFGKSENWSIVAVVLPGIINPLIAFDKSTYQMVPKKKPSKPKEEKIDDNIELKSENKIVNILKWIATICLFILALGSISLYVEEHLLSDIIMAIFMFIFSLMICPDITKQTKRFKFYTKYKWLITILLIITFVFLVGTID